MINLVAFFFPSINFVIYPTLETIFSEKLRGCGGLVEYAKMCKSGSVAARADEIRDSQESMVLTLKNYMRKGSSQVESSL